MGTTIKGGDMPRPGRNVFDLSVFTSTFTTDQRVLWGVPESIVLGGIPFPVPFT